MVITLVFEIYSVISLQIIYVLAVITILFGFFIVWENETVVSGAKTEWSREDSVVGAIAIYMNVFTLVLHVNSLVSAVLTERT